MIIIIVGGWWYSNSSLLHHLPSLDDDVGKYVNIICRRCCLDTCASFAEEWMNLLFLFDFSGEKRKESLVILHLTRIKSAVDSEDKSCTFSIRGTKNNRVPNFHTDEWKITIHLTKDAIREDARFVEGERATAKSTKLG